MRLLMALLLVMATLLHAVSSSFSSSSSSSSRPTPVVSRFAPRPTPATTSTPTRAPALPDDSRLARTEIHVLEKCCPHASAFAVREYPSAMEDDGWMPALTLHAYKYQRWLPNCWQIVNTTDNNTTAPSSSQRWKRIHRSASKTPRRTGVAPSESDSFCLPTENRLPDASVSVFYVESADKRASFVSQPIRNASQLFFNSFTLSGWNDSSSHSNAPVFRRVNPLAYYYWRTLMPMPQRLITDVRLHAAERTAPLECDNGYEIVPGNLNYNFVGDPVAYFCVRYGYGAFVDPRFSLSSQPSQYETFLTDIVILAKTPYWLRNETAPINREIMLTEGLTTARQTSNVLNGDCNAPLEPIASTYEFWTREDGSSERTAQIDALKATLSQLKLTSTYSVFTGNSEWLVFCMEKKPLVDVSNGRFLPAASFVDRLFLDLTEIVRRHRLGVVYNMEEPVEAKQSPFGRIYYDVEDAKDQAIHGRGGAFDEL